MCHSMFWDEKRLQIINFCSNWIKTKSQDNVMKRVKKLKAKNLRNTSIKTAWMKLEQGMSNIKIHKNTN